MIAEIQKQINENNKAISELNRGVFRGYYNMAHYVAENNRLNALLGNFGALMDLYNEIMVPLFS